MNLNTLFENLSPQQRRVGQLPAEFKPRATSPVLDGPYGKENATQGYLVGEDVTEGRVKELGQDLEDPLMSDEEFETKYGDSRANMQGRAGRVQDRKTGRFYDPDQEFDKLKNSPEFGAQMRRMSEGYPKHQDLSGISTDKLKAYLDKQSKQQVSGEGNQVKRVRAELQRRQQGVAEGAPELLKKEMPLHRHAEKLLAQNGVSKDDPDYNHHLGNTIKHLRQFGNIDLINKQGVAEGMSRDEYNQIQYAIDNFKDEYGEEPSGPDIFNIADSLGVEPDAVINVLYGRIVPEQGVAEDAKKDMSKEVKAMATGTCPHCKGPVKKKEFSTLTQYHCPACGIRASQDKSGVTEGDVFRRHGKNRNPTIDELEMWIKNWTSFQIGGNLTDAGRAKVGQSIAKAQRLLAKKKQQPGVVEAALKGTAEEYAARAQAAEAKYLKYENLVDQELQKLGQRLPQSWDAGRMNTKLSSHPKYALALKYYTLSEKFASQAIRYEQLAKKKSGVTETALRDKADLVAKRRALQDLSRDPGVDQRAVQQRQQDLEKEARSRGLNEFALDDDNDPTEDYPCYDCGSTIFLHHTKLCDLAEPNATRDLPAKPGTQYWTGQVPKGLVPIPGLAEGVAEGSNTKTIKPITPAAKRYHEKHQWLLNGNIPGAAKEHYDMIQKLNQKGVAEGVELMTDAEVYRETLGVLALMGAGFAAGAYAKIKDIIKMYNADQIMRALEGYSVSNISDAERQALTKLIAEFKQAMAQRQGKQALAIAKQIKTIATDRPAVAEASFETEPVKLNPGDAVTYQGAPAEVMSVAGNSVTLRHGGTTKSVPARTVSETVDYAVMVNESVKRVFPARILAENYAAQLQQRRPQATVTVAEQHTTEDVVSDVKDRVGDYLQNVADAVKKDPALLDKITSAANNLGPAVKTLKTVDGHEIKIHGNEDDGFRISISNKALKARFPKMEHAVMATEMYCARRQQQETNSDYLPEA